MVQRLAMAVFLTAGILLFLVFPPLVFSYVEGWSYGEGFYFTFITLSTIGFGDYVVGNNEDTHGWILSFCPHSHLSGRKFVDIRYSSESLSTESIDNYFPVNMVWERESADNNEVIRGMGIFSFKQLSWKSLYSFDVWHWILIQQWLYPKWYECNPWVTAGIWVKSLKSLRHPLLTVICFSKCLPFPIQKSVKYETLSTDSGKNITNNP